MQGFGDIGGVYSGAVWLLFLFFDSSKAQSTVCFLAIIDGKKDLLSWAKPESLYSSNVIPDT